MTAAALIVRNVDRRRGILGAIPFNRAAREWFSDDPVFRALSVASRGPS